MDVVGQNKRSLNIKLYTNFDAFIKVVRTGSLEFFYTTQDRRIKKVESKKNEGE